MHKTTQFWLAPNRVEDVFVLKLWKWTLGRNQNRTPLRRFTVQYCFFWCHFIYFICLIIVLCFWQCYKFCRRRGVRNVHGNYKPVQTVRISVFLVFISFSISFMYLFFFRLNSELLIKIIKHIMDALPQKCVL